MSEVNLSISDELVQPIIEAKIQSAICAALSGQQEIVSKVIEKILTMKVNKEGQRDTYGYRDSKTFIQWLCENAIHDAAKEAVKAWVSQSNEKLKKELEKILQRRTRSIAESVISSMITGIERDWNLKVEVKAENLKPSY